MKKYITILILAILISISGCAPNTSPSMENSVTSIGQLTPNITASGENTFLIKDKISPSYSVYSFEFAYHNELDEAKKEHYQKEFPEKYYFDEQYVDLNIRDENGDLIQKIKMVGTPVFHKDGYHITDFNFDGYKDILLLYDVQGNHANHFYCGWLWNDESKHFEEIALDMVNIAIDRTNECILSVATNWAASHTYSMYKYIGKEFVLTNELTIEAVTSDKFERYRISNLREDDDPWIYIEKKLSNGKVTTIQDFVVVFPNDKVGKRKADQLYHSENSMWAVSSLKWYQSDYGSGLGIQDKDGQEIKVEMDKD
jgi:hypothetical protein